ncbi:FAR-17a/AIG1-like protein [Crepidotus variabilis]|uniref:FAR-17a/AIG1-like protein n=1 Tax=Crepidotus variabilis TaxID=179855 RepID=A0A9P6EP19_9AGAR|nr:FAR-17a/AIG1-like protein [Crepidotus variabilis]
MATVRRAVFHGGAALLMHNGYNSLGGLEIDKFIQKQYGGHLQYLTIQGLAFAWFAMTLSLAHDSFPSLPFLRNLKRYVMIIAMPLSVVISSIYWTLIVYFPTLIVQGAKEAPGEPNSSADTVASFRIPLKVDLLLHALPAVSLILDFFFFEKKYTNKESKIAVPLTAVLYGIGYGVWIEHCANHNDGVFPYPFLTENNLYGRIGIYAGAAAIAVGSFRILNALHL